MTRKLMSRRSTIKWWAYVWSGIILLLFVAPALISAADDIFVLLGFGLLIAYGWWSWKFWIRKIFL